MDAVVLKEQDFDEHEHDDSRESAGEGRSRDRASPGSRRRVLVGRTNNSRDVPAESEKSHQDDSQERNGV